MKDRRRDAADNRHDRPPKEGRIDDRAAAIRRLDDDLRDGGGLSPEETLVRNVSGHRGVDEARLDQNRPRVRLREPVSNPFDSGLQTITPMP